MDSLSKTRERRSNAGNRMAQMLDKEEEDFYKNTYGGFFEEDNDNEYMSEDSVSDNVDSDFDIDENDEVIDFEDEEENKKRRGRLVTKAYKEPRKQVVRIHKKQKHIKRKISKDEDFDQDEEENEDEVNEKFDTLKSPNEKSQYISNEKKSLRASTQLKSKATQKRSKLAQETKKRKHVRVHYKELTQEELLKEARETEKINLKSLERYEKLELEKSRKNKTIKKNIKGPIIRYQSMTMPLIEELYDNLNSNNQKKCSRNFITFTEDETFNQIFKDRKFKPNLVKRQSICSISKLPARYLDPITNCPFSSTFSFRTLREAYYKQLELIDESQKTDEIKFFLEWRKNRLNVLNDLKKSESSILNVEDTISENSNSNFSQGTENVKIETLDHRDNNIVNGSNNCEQSQTIEIISSN